MKKVIQVFAVATAAVCLALASNAAFADAAKTDSAPVETKYFDETGSVVAEINYFTIMDDQGNLVMPCSLEPDPLVDENGEIAGIFLDKNTLTGAPESALVLYENGKTVDVTVQAAQ